MIRLGQRPPQAAPDGDASPGAMAIQQTLPAQLGEYRLLRPIAQGGMSAVHLAAGPDGRLVAVKVLRLPAAGDEQARCRLGREVAAMRRVHSPFVAEVIDADVTGEIPYIVTRFVPGPTLAQVVTGHGPLHGQALQRLAHGLAEALAAVHAAGIVHRDLKPGNVMLDGGEPVLIDFGIAYQAGDAPLTQTGMYLGTPGYLAPEVIEGQRAQAPADVHAWGATVGFAARGQPVFGTGPYEAVFCRILRSDATLEGVDGRLYPLVAAALLRQPAQRPSAAWLAREVADLDLAVPAPAAAGVPQAPDGHGRAAKPGMRASRAAVWWQGAASRAAVWWQAAASRAAVWRQAAACRAAAREQAVHHGPGEVADLLPAVRYAPAVRVAAPGHPVAHTRRPRRHRLLGLVSLALAVGGSFVLPLAGTVTVAALLTILRTASRARRGLAVRRTARGPRIRDPLLLAGSLPWALARSVIETALLAPLLLAVAVAANTAAIFADPGAHLLPAGAAVAVAYTTLSCLGPRSRRARRELDRAFDTVASTPLTAAMALLTLAVLATTIASLMLINAPPLWPLPGLHGIQVHLPGLNRASLAG